MFLKTFIRYKISFNLDYVYFFLWQRTEDFTTPMASGGVCRLSLKENELSLSMFSTLFCQEQYSLEK